MGFRRTKDKVKVGSVAPDFTLPSQSGEMVSLKDLPWQEARCHGVSTIQRTDTLSYASASC
jgi:hypothetical protein